MRLRDTVTVFTAALLVACVSAPVPLQEVEKRSNRVPIHDRYSRARLILLDEINADRADEGARPVVLDSLATAVAQEHAERMAAGDYLSHYSTDGRSPYERLSAAGGTAHVRENVFRYRVGGSGSGPSGRAWARFDVREAEKWLMASPGHRATILDATRTHVGLGIAETPGRDAVYVVQEFLARHAELRVPARGWRRATTVVEGRMVDENVRPLLVYVTREPAVRSWVGASVTPPGGSYPDGAGEGFLVPPWRIRWNRTDRSFRVEIPPDLLDGPGRYYGIVYVAPEDVVRDARGRRAVESDRGWPGAAFLVEVL